MQKHWNLTSEIEIHLIYSISFSEVAGYWMKTWFMCYSYFSKHNCAQNHISTQTQTFDVYTSGASIWLVQSLLTEQIKPRMHFIMAARGGTHSISGTGSQGVVWEVLPNWCQVWTVVSQIGLLLKGSCGGTGEAGPASTWPVCRSITGRSHTIRAHTLLHVGGVSDYPCTYLCSLGEETLEKTIINIVENMNTPNTQVLLTG